MATEVIRYVLIGVALFVLGFNGALIWHTGKIVHAVTAWRMFILGKSGLTAYVIVSLYDARHGPLSWRIPLAGTALLVTLVSIILLDHNYRITHPPRSRHP